MKDEYFELEEKLRSFPTAEPPEGLREQILLKAAIQPQRRAGWKFRLALAMGVFVLLALTLD